MKLLTKIQKMIGEVVLRFLNLCQRFSLIFLRQSKLKARFLTLNGRLLSDALASFDSNKSLIVLNQKYLKSKLFVSDGSIKMSLSGTDRYIKAPDSRYEGYDHIEVLNKFGVSKPKTIVDIGANFGEISLCFALKFPDAKIIAVEPSSSNLEILEDNLSIQDFSTQNISVKKYGISDEFREVKITKNLGSQNSIVAKRNLPSSSYETIECKRLDELYTQESVSSCDYLKIDIEGAEPGLAESLGQVLGKTKVVLMEFSHKNTSAEYAKVIAQFQAAKDEWQCFSVKDTDSAIALDEAINYYNGNGKKKKPSADFWFVNRTKIAKTLAG